MAIDVTCPGCQKKFKVSDQFAGKKGPCPQCKTVITIPEKSTEVVIHAPETEGPKGAGGRPVLRPIFREETKLTPVMIGTIVGIAVAALVGALVLRLTFPAHNIPRVVLALGAMLLAPPLVFGGYSFLRDQELEPHRGRAMMIRTAICSAVYVALWGLYAWLPTQLGLDPVVPMHLTFILPVMVAIGALGSFASLDLDFGTGAMHYGLYLLVTLLLCFIAGWPLWTTVTS
jgi:hypothetical protein